MSYFKTLLISLFLLADPGLSAKENMNVLFIAIDDLNDWIGPMGGNPAVKTPNFDKFYANGGMSMYKAHSPSTVCGPARSAIMTGKHCFNTGVYGNETNLKNAPKAKDLLTIPEWFSQHGYHSLSAGKIFHKHPKAKEIDHGQWAFDEHHVIKGGIGALSKEKPANGLLDLDGKKMQGKGLEFDWGATVKNDTTLMKDYKTADWAVDQFQKRSFDKPFFMAVGFSKPHLPWFVPQKYFDMYPLNKIEIPEIKDNPHEQIITSEGKFIYGQSFREDAKRWGRAEKYGVTKNAIQAYMANVTFVDDCLGHLLDGLNNSPYAENTIVVLWGDHGWHLGEKKRFGKCLLWQESTRVPLMIKVPGVTPNKKRCDGVVNLIDLYPTLSELCNIPVNPTNDGRSFAKLVNKPDMKWNQPTLTTWLEGNHRIYDGRYSYINWRGGDELYDHKNDPMEHNNLANNPEYAKIMAKLKAHIPTHNEPESPKNNFDKKKMKELYKKQAAK